MDLDDRALLRSSRPDNGTSSLASTPSNSDESLLSLDGGFVRYKKPNIVVQMYARFYWIVALFSGCIGVGCILISIFAIPMPSFLDEGSDPTAGFQARHTYISLRHTTFLALLASPMTDLPQQSQPTALKRRAVVIANHDTSYSAANTSNISSSKSSRPTTTTTTTTSTTSTTTTRPSSRPTTTTTTLHPPVEIGSRHTNYPGPACLDPQVSKSDIRNRLKLVFESNEPDRDLFNLHSFQSICDIENTFIRPSLPRSIVNYPCPYMISLPTITAAYSRKNCKDMTEQDVTNMKNLLADCYPYYKKTHSLLGTRAPAKCTSTVNTIFYYLTDVNFKPSHNASTKLTYTTMIYSWTNTRTDYFKRVFEGKHISHGSVKLVSVYGNLDEKFELFEDYLLSDLEYYIGALSCSLIGIVMFLYLFSFVLVVASFINVIFSFATAYVFYYYVFGIHFFPFINLLAALILVAIGADDVFIFYDSWKQAKKDDSDVPLENRIGRAFSHAAVSIAVTSLTTAASFFANYNTKIVSIKCFAIFAGFAVLANFFYMLTWTPSIIVAIEVVEKSMKYLLQALKRAFHVVIACRTNISRVIFNQALPWLIEKAWFIWIPLFLLIGVGGFVIVLYKPGLQLPKSKEFQLFSSNQLMEHWDQTTKMQFMFERDNVDRQLIGLHVIWGVLPRDNGMWYNVSDIGTLVPDKDFDMFAPESQQFMVDFVNSTLYSDIVDVSDYMKKNKLSIFEAIQLMLYNCKNPPGKDTVFDSYRNEICVENETEIPFSRAYLQQNFAKLVTVVQQFVDKQRIIGQPKFNNASLGCFIISIRSNQYFTTSYDEMDEFYKKMDAFIRKWNMRAPVGLSRGFVSGYWDFTFYALQKALADGTYYSIMWSLTGAGILMLLTSLNPLLTIYAMVTITLAISSTIGSFVLLGWHLNIIESITLSLAVGLSIDFTIHYGMSYRLSKEKHRLARTRESFSRVGSAIVMAAFTTFVAGAAMMPTNIRPYFQLGAFLMVVMSLSWLYSTFLFMSLCRIIGPNGNTCQIRFPCWKKKRNDEEEREEEEEEVAGIYQSPFSTSDPTLQLNSLDHNVAPIDDFMIVA